MPRDLPPYGCPGITEELKELGANVGHSRGGGLMRENAIRVNPYMSRSLPRVAVLLPTYIGEAHLRQQVGSILNSCSVDAHIFAHDDGFSDETTAILQSYGENISLLHANPTGSAAQTFGSSYIGGGIGSAPYV